MPHSATVKHARPQTQGVEAGLLTPPPSQPHEDSIAASSLMSPPPEETLRTPRARSAPATARNSVTPGQDPNERFTGHVISNTISSKRKRNTSSITSPSSSYIVRSTSVDMDTRDNTDNSQKLMEATPNPKPRKQSKRSVSFAPESPIRPSLQHSASPTKASQKRASLSPTKRSFLIQSPHAANPHADYIPPSPSHAREQISTRRRSITPIPPYEPPSERFTPPREVLCTPVNLTSPKISKSSKRKSAINSHGKTKKLVLQIKKELPDDIDLNAPPPPPSPTDDPLLLTGPPGSRKKRQSQLRQSHVTHSRETPPLASSSPIRGEDLQHTQLLDLTLGAAGMDLTSDDFNSTLNTFVAPLPIFDFASTNEDDAWTDDPSSDEEGASPFDGTGEFTGKFKMRTVPTKVDPPSSCTKQRMDAWGHPVSPFPDGERRRSQGGEEGNEDVVETSGKQVTSEVLQDEDVFGRPEIPQIVEGSSTVARNFPSASESLAPSEEAVTVQVESVVTTLSPVPESEVEEPTVGVQPTYRKSTPPSGPFDFGALGDQSFEVSYEAPQEPTEEEVAPVQDNSMEVQMEQHPVQDRQVHFVGVESGTSSDAMSTVEEPSEPHHEPEEEVSALSEVHRSPSPAVGQHVNIARVPRSPTPARVLDTSVDEVCFEEPSILEEDSSLKDDSGYLEAPETIPAVKSSETAAPVSAPETPTRRSATATQPTGVPRTPAPQIPVVESDDEEEDDEVVVFRELSQPPEVDSDEEPEKNDDLLARSFARVTLMSPSNPFQPATPGPALSTPVTHPASNSFEQTRREWRQHSSGVDGAGSSTVQARYIFTSDHPVVAEDEGVEEDGSEDEELDEKVIKITSDDPRAAARAAAILRLHRYNCLEEYNRRKRRHSQSSVNSILEKSRRRTTNESGVSKTSPSSTPRRRRTLGGVIGDKVYIPGSPVISLPELLNEAEVSVHLEGEDSPHRARSPLGSVKFPVTPQYDSTQFETPTRKPSSISKPFLDPNDIPSLRRQSLRTPMDFPTPAPRQWSKDDWRLMDGCYTDERYALSERLGLGVEEMADADQVDLMNVVERYVEVIGGQGTVDVLGESWTRENLLKRARALQRKQHSGNAAPPTPARASSVLSNDTATGSYQRYMSSMSPEPAPSQDISYSLLMDDAIAVASDQPKQPIITSYLKSQPAPRRRQSAFGRMKGFFFSYLSTAPKPKPAPPKGPAQPGYPIPPPEVFQKPRGPVSTPASKAPPKPVHPKEIVNLQPAPSKSSENQRNPKDPKRLVDLHPVPQPLEPEPQPISRERRGSNASVKDLVHSFEEMQRRQSMELDKERESLSRLEMRRTRSIREWNGGNPRAAKLNGTAKPVWKP